MIRAILVDDEQNAIKAMELMLTEHCKNVNIIGKAYNAMEAVKLILVEKPDLVFLDVQMPGYTGFDVLEQIKELNCKIIFTTAYNEYAIAALRKGAFDYLLKPMDINDLKNCIIRIEEELHKQIVPTKAKSSLMELAIKNGIIYFKMEEIIHIEASGSYTYFYLDNDIKHIGSKSMKDYELVLDPSIFYRTHNSHIINLKKVKKFISTDGFFAEMVDGKMINISRRNKDEFLERLKLL
jgi:two-component system, LytTR family, response regulator